MKLGNHVKFELTVAPEGVSLIVGDVLVWDKVPLPGNAVKQKYSKIGFGGIVVDNETIATISNIKVSR